MAVVGDQPPGDVREALLDNGEVLVRLQPQPLQRGEGPEDQGEVRRQSEVPNVRVGDLLHLLGQAAASGGRLELLVLFQEHVLLGLQVAPLLVQRLQRRRQRWQDDLNRKLVLSQRFGEELQRDQVHQARFVLLGLQVHQELDEGEPFLSRDCRHEPVVQDAQLAILQPDEVPRVRVPVQEARLQELHHVAVEEQGDHLLRLRLVERGLVELRAVEPLLHEDLPRAEEHLRHRDRVADEVAVGDGLGETPLVRRLCLVVELPQEVRRGDVEQLVHLLALLRERLEREVLPDIGESPHQVQVQGGLLPDVRPLHLDSDGLPLNGALVHLPNAGGSDGPVEAREVVHEVQGGDTASFGLAQRHEGLLF
mmetsp:Transcript_93176/g.268170  ORF Transcript_93176/g.268170 Transcript_93176/m.268170 type:complete len:366 (-) Transcript_93176:480-1577(-)